jgi:hypothetical protein
MLKNTIIPSIQYRFGSSDSLDFSSICEFISLGYFIGDKTYFKELKQALPATNFEVDGNQIIKSQEYFKWHYSPSERSFDELYDEFVSILEGSVGKAGENVIIPISGGLDSRTLVLAASRLQKNIVGYSYRFDNGWDETKYGLEIAKHFGFQFRDFSVKSGVLWDYIDKIAQRNQCYSEFTHARQFAFYEILKSEFKGTFLLGHGGDLFFDQMNVSESLSMNQQKEEIFKRMVKPSCLNLAQKLWEVWGISGSFNNHLKESLNNAYESINIENVNAHFRAFKSKYYVPRWTCTNLEIFNDFGPVCLPYFGDDMCKFICTVPESILAGRKLQIEYIKRNSAFLTSMEWESNKPFNLNNYKWNKSPYNLPYRALNKLKRSLNSTKYIQRNWELQFLGKNNENQLTERIFSLSELIDSKILSQSIGNFKNEPKNNFHAITMLLTLAQFQKQFIEKR